ncbi:MAG: LPS assembly protein LptD [Candidatus Omnitrophota bacterium]
MSTTPLNRARYISSLLVFALTFWQAAAYPVFAQDALLEKIKRSDEPVTVKGDKVEYFRDENKIVGEGNVSIAYGDVELKCDKITVYTDTKEAICEGSVVITQPGACMSGDRINYNFTEKKGYAIDSHIKADPFYGSAGRVEQTGDKEFAVKEGYITTCDLDTPHYRIRAKEVKLFLGKKVVAKHVVFYVGKIPVLYLPLFVQPMVEKKPEVTVVPGRTGDWGYYALTAWRYYFDENSKGHVHLDYREKKGLAEGIDYKYKIKELGNGMARFYYAHENDDLTVNRSGSKDDRWRIQYRHTIDLPEDTVGTLELNKLSDEDIIKDYLYREFEDNPAPDNYILVKTTKPNYVLTLLARKRLNTFFDVVERLPEAKLEVNDQRLWTTNFYYRSENSITNFIKRASDYGIPEDNSPERSLRIDNFHKLSYAAKLFKFLYVTPFAGTRQTFYSMNRWKEESRLRSIYEGGVDLSTKFYRVYDVNSNILNLDLHHVRHIITPSAGFLHRHQPTIDPSSLYQFDGIDNIEQHNGFDLSLESKFQTKRPDGEKMKTVDLATFIVSTDYLFKLEKRSLGSQGVGRFGDLTFDLELRPYAWLFVDSDMTLDHKDHDINSANIDVYVNIGEKISMGLGHRYESTSDNRTSQFTGEMLYNINDDWKIKLYERVDCESQRLEEQEYTIFKDLHCWLAEVTFNIRETEFDTEYSAWIVFKLKAYPNLPIGLPRTTYHRPQPGGRY